MLLGAVVFMICVVFACFCVFCSLLALLVAVYWLLFWMGMRYVVSVDLMCSWSSFMEWLAMFWGATCWCLLVLIFD